MWLGFQDDLAEPKRARPIDFIRKYFARAKQLRASAATARRTARQVERTRP